MADRRRGGWAYMSIVSAVPGLSVNPRLALAVQFVLFEAIAVALALAYDLVGALALATVAVAVSTAGSGLMMAITDRLEAADPPARYRRVLFDSSLDVVMGVVAFGLLVTYLLVTARGPAPGALTRLIGTAAPAPAVFFAMVLAWDVCYRIGTAWWAGITGLWRAVAFGPAGDRLGAAYRRIDRLTVAFAGLQLLLVPFLLDERPLALLVAGHVAAVAVVTGAALAAQRAG